MPIKTPKSLPYENSTAGERALDQLRRILEGFGCQSFGIMTDVQHSETSVYFKWRERQVNLRASWKGYAEMYLKIHPVRRYGATRQRRMEAIEAQAKLSVCSILRDWVKGQITAVECGIMSFEAAFMPHILLPSGERIIDRLQAPNGLIAIEFLSDKKAQETYHSGEEP